MDDWFPQLCYQLFHSYQITSFSGRIDISHIYLYTCEGFKLLSSMILVVVVVVVMVVRVGVVVVMG